MSNGAYARHTSRAISRPRGVLGRGREAIDWVTPPTTRPRRLRPAVLPLVPDGKLNACYNALDRHVARGRGEQAAIHYDCPVTGTSATLTYAALLARVATFAGALASLGVDKGDRVVIYMPMVPEAVVAMLACARIGAIHSVVFGGFAPEELAARIEDAKPVVHRRASCGVEPSRVVEYKPLLDDAIHRCSHQPEPRHRPAARAGTGRARRARHRLGGARLGRARRRRRAGRLRRGRGDRPALHPLHLGHDGEAQGHLPRQRRPRRRAALVDGEHLRHRPGETWFTASDVGWVVGHSYIVYAPLLTGATTVLYEGKPVGTPDAGAFWRVIADYGVKAMFTAPTAFRAIKKEDPTASLIAGHDLSRLTTRLPRR